MNISLLKEKLVLILLIFYCCFANGQNKIDALKNELNRATNDLERMELSSKLSKSMRYKNTKQSINYIKEALEFANKIGNEQDKIKYQSQLSALYSINRDYDKSIEINNHILETQPQLEDSLLIEIHNIQALNYHGLGELHLAIKYGKKAIQLGKHHNLAKLSIPAIGCLAKINMDNNKYDESLAYFLQAIKESITYNRYIQIAYLNKDLAELYFFRGEYDKGIASAEKAISFSKKYNLYIIENDARINLSWLYRATNQLEKALTTVNEAIKNLTDKKHTPLLLRAKNSKAAILSQMGQVDEALDLALKTLNTAKKEKRQKQVIHFHECIAKLYGKKEDFKNAYFHQKKAEDLGSIILKSEKTKIIKLAEFTAKNESKNIDAQIAKANLYQRITNTFGYTIAICLWIGLVLILVFWRFNNNSYQLKYIIPTSSQKSEDLKFYMAQKISFWSFLMLIPITFHFYFWDVKGLLYSSSFVNLMFILIYFLSKKKNMKGIFYASLTPYFICAIAPLFASNLHSIPIAIVATFIINCFLIPQRFYLIINIIFACISTIFYLYSQSISQSAHIPFSTELDLLITLIGIILIVFKISYYFKSLSDLSKKIYKNNDFLNQIADINPHFIFTKNKKREFTFVNEALAKVYQFDKAKLIGKKIEDFNPHLSENLHFKEEDLKVLNEGVSIIAKEEKVMDSNGKEIWLQTTKKPLFDDDNNIIGLFGIANNITDKKNAEFRIIESETRYRKLFDHSFDGLFIIDDDCNIEDCNDNVISFLKYPNKELLKSKNLRKLFPTCCKAEDFLEFLNSEKLFLPSKTSTIINFFGNHQQVEYTILKILTHDETQIVCTIKDISEKIELEKKDQELNIQKIEIQRINDELVAQTISENHQNKFLTEVKKNINTIINDVEGKSKMELNKLVRKIGNAINSEDNFYQFKLKFQKSHPDFFEKLNQINPSLTPTDLKICAYIKLELSAEDMANILSIEKRSVEMAKYRLKKKVNLSKDDNLNTFITTL